MPTLGSIRLDDLRRRVLNTLLVHAVLKDARVADDFRAVDLSADEVSFTEKQVDIIRAQMAWARNEFIRAKQDLDDVEDARVEIEGELAAVRP